MVDLLQAARKQSLFAFVGAITSASKNLIERTEEIFLIL